MEVQGSCGVQRGGEVVGVGAESAQYLGPGPSPLSPCFLPPPMLIPRWPPPLPHPVGVIISSVRCGCFA